MWGLQWVSSITQIEASAKKRRLLLRRSRLRARKLLDPTTYQCAGLEVAEAGGSTSVNQPGATFRNIRPMLTSPGSLTC